MTEKQYLAEMERIHKRYAKIERRWRNCADSRMLLAIQHEKNDQLTELAKRYHSQTIQ